MSAYVDTTDLQPRSALFLCGGWEGHHPREFCEILAGGLQQRGFVTRIETTPAILDSEQEAKGFDLIVPFWTMGSLDEPKTKHLLAAVREGTGLGGMHGGMGDAFRGNTAYEWAVGGHFVGHPHVGNFTVRRTAVQHTIVEGLPAAFDYHSEQYYMLVDPANEVLAETIYEHDGRSCAMPVVWVKTHGRGRVFYSALGHAPDEFVKYPQVLEMTLRGLHWAARHT